jgi:hypothetical protein
MRAFFTLASALSIAAAPATPQWSDSRPPVRFQGLGLTLVLFVEPEMIWSVCGNPKDPPPPGSFIRACTRTIKIDKQDVPVVVMPDPCRFPDEVFSGIQCHENAHRFKGWSHETP